MKQILHKNQQLSFQSQSEIVEEGKAEELDKSIKKYGKLFFVLMKSSKFILSPKELLNFMSTNKQNLLLKPKIMQFILGQYKIESN